MILVTQNCLPLAIAELKKPGQIRPYFTSPGQFILKNKGGLRNMNDYT